MKKLIIYKYALKPGRTDLQLPLRAKILTVQAQNNEPVLWVLLDPDEPLIGRTFQVVPTGHPLQLKEQDALLYVGTFQLHGGGLVFHVFTNEAP